jgi:hypothetical protein
MLYIDYFLKAQSELNDPEYGMPEYINKLKDIIEQGIKLGANYPDVKVKYTWMKNKFNLLVESAKRDEFLEALEDPELRDYYNQLSKI